MTDSYINVSSITYAIKGRDLLLSRGIRAYIERTPAHIDRMGCGYSIFVKGDAQRAEQILRNGGIKILYKSAGGEK